MTDDRWLVTGAVPIVFLLAGYTISHINSLAVLAIFSTRATRFILMAYVMQCRTPRTTDFIQGTTKINCLLASDKRPSLLPSICFPK
jgi:hypothetical protein